MRDVSPQRALLAISVPFHKWPERGANVNRSMARGGGFFHVTDFGSREGTPWLYWALLVASVVEASFNGGALSFAVWLRHCHFLLAGRTQ
jgi:hypothetical protein